jgi:predicted permease
MSRSARLYQSLLRALGGELRREYADDMAAAFDAMLADARADGRPLPWLRTWGRSLTDLLAAASAEHFGGGRRMHRTGYADPRNRPMETLLRDLRFALRSLLRQPLFTTVAALTIALGIAATTTIFTVAETMLLRTPPGVREPGDLVTLHRLGEDGSSFHAFDTPMFRHLAGADTGLVELAAVDTFGGGLGVAGAVPVPVAGALVSWNYFPTVGARPLLGRFFHAAEDAPGADARVAVISEQLWRRQFGADPEVIGRQVDLNGRDFSIVGVAEPGFAGHLAVVGEELWVPLSARATMRNISAENEALIGGLELIGRRAPGVELSVAREGVDRAAALWSAEDEDSRGEWHGIDLFAYSPVLPMARGGVVVFFSALLAVAGILLAITAMNVASMMLSRGAARSREIAVRLAMGATRGRIIRQLLVESVVLFLFGGALGTALTVWITGLGSRIELPIPISVDLAFTPNLPVYLFALAVAGTTGVVFGLAPAFRSTGGDLNEALKQGRGAAPAQQHRGKAALLVAQVAGSAVLLVAAGLLARSLVRAGSVDIGLDPTGIQAVEIDTRLAGGTSEESRQFFKRALQAAAALPGVERVAATDILPLTLSNQESFVVLPDLPAEPGVGLRRVDFAIVTPGYFETLSIPLTAGRDFGDGDTPDSTQVAIVNETLARSIAGDGRVVGERIGFGSTDDPTTVEIVGVAGDSKVRSIGDDPRPVIYRPSTQLSSRTMTLLVRSASVEIAPPLRERIHELDPALPPVTPMPYERMIGLSLLPGRIAAGLAIAFGVVGLLLTGIGLYGLLAYAVTLRQREIGVRMALGAHASEVRRLILRDGLRLVGLGAAIGLGLGAIGGLLLRNLVSGIEPFDPLTFGAVSVVLLLVAAAACWVPARRAVATDPIEALRAE